MGKLDSSDELPEISTEPQPIAPSAIDKRLPNDLPQNIVRAYPSALEAKRIKKPLVCYLLDIDPEKRTKPTLVMKPIKVKYGAKWFDVGREQRYFINYNQIMNFGKHYAYLCQYGNAIGALSFYEYPDIAQDANQVMLMTNQHAVEVFKKHKGISPKLVMIIAIVAMIGVIGTVISANVAIGFNGQIVAKNKQIETLTAQNAELKAQLTELGQDVT
jgi:cell division protein FtsL